MNSNLNGDKTILLIDSNALVHRAYHAFPATLTTKDGMQVNAVYGFSKLLLEVLEKFKPKYAVCAFDTKKPTVRHLQYVGYKATRKATEPELTNQFPIIYDVVKAFNIPLLKVEGFEADDIIGTICEKLKDTEYKKIIVTGDADLMQLVDDKTYSFMAGSAFKESKLYDFDGVKEKFGFTPDYIIDYKAIRGDTSDNIPGIKGIGEKGATSLIQEFGHLDNIYKNIEMISGRNKQKLVDSYDMAVLSLSLATIIKDVPLNFSIDDAVLNDYDAQKVTEIFRKLEFRSLINKLPASTNSNSQPSAIINNQMDMFGSEKQESVADSSFKFEIIKNIEALDKLIIKLNSDKIYAFDTETDSLDVMNAKLLGISFSNGNDSYYVNYSTLKSDQAINKLKDLFGDEKTTKIAHNAKYDMHILKNLGIDVKGEIQDSMLMAYLLSEGESRIGLKELAFNELGISMDNYSELFGGKIDINNVDEEKLARYASQDAHSTYLLYKKFTDKLNTDNNKDLLKLYSDVELPVMKILFEMEREGIFLNKEKIQLLSKKLSIDLKRIEKEIFEIVGHEFNINSPKQMSVILFEELGLKGAKKNKSGGFSTNERILMDLYDIHPIIPKILEYRELNKLRSTYTDVLVDRINKDTGRLHTSFNQAVTATGRLSSSDPNLQNIPVSTENGMKIRDAFESEKGRIFLALDVAQQELRVVAILSKETKLIEAFEKGIDVHSLTASEIFGTDISMINQDQRRIGKTLNFSLLYGISAFGLSDRLKISREQSQEMIESFWKTYPKIKTYFGNLLLEAQKTGFVQTFFGRRRSAVLLNSSNFRIRNSTQRELINFPIQGTSADLMKMSMIRVYNYLSKTKSNLNPKIILQVHDELILEVNEVEMDELVEFAKIIREEMVGKDKYDVKMEVDIKIGYNWANLKKII